jgi:hypothetical protein
LIGESRTAVTGPLNNVEASRRSGAAAAVRDVQDGLAEGLTGADLQEFVRLTYRDVE